MSYPYRVYPDDSTPSISLSPHGSNIDGRDSVFMSASREDGMTIYNIDYQYRSTLLVSDSNDRVVTIHH